MTARSAEPESKIYKAICFTGHSPSLHADTKIKFLTAHAIFNAATKNVERMLQVLFIKSSKIQIEQSIK